MMIQTASDGEATIEVGVLSSVPIDKLSLGKKDPLAIWAAFYM